MLLYRISEAKYATGLSASGRSARWNKDHQFVLYTADSEALCTLECVAHRASIFPSKEYKLMFIEIKNIERYTQEITLKRIEDIFTKLTGEKDAWKSIESYSVLQLITNDWYDNNTSLVLKVPSALTLNDSNYIINTRHPDIDKVSILKTEDFNFDNRLL